MRTERTNTPVCLRIGSGQNQSRNVQRRDRKGGGDGPPRASITIAQWEHKTSTDRIATVPSSCSGLGLASSFFPSGKGAWERAQQEVVLTFQV